MFGRFKIYTVHVGVNDRGVQHKPVFVREGFNAMAFLFPLFWALYKRLWIPALLIFAIDMLFWYVMRGHIFGRPTISAVDLAFRVMIGYQANDWLRSHLQKSGFVLSDISAADSLLHAEQRYFERYLAASAPK